MAEARRRLQALWVAVGVQLLGWLVDLRWHLTNEEFEGVSEQFEAHWLLWLGVLGALLVSLLAARERGTPAPERRGYLFLLGSGLAYTGVAVWHFVEHANGNDPELAHVLLGLTQIGMILGAVLATLGARRGQPLGAPSASPPR